LVKSNNKQLLKGYWQYISIIDALEFEFEKKSDFLLWNNKEGRELIIQIKEKKQWNELETELNQILETEFIPDRMLSNSNLYPLFIAVFNHRLNKEGIIWFENLIEKNEIIN
jgi:hypothetical protein